MPFEQAPQRFVHPFLADVLTQRVERERALAVGHVRVEPTEQRFPSANGRIRIRLPHEAQKPPKVIGSPGVLHDFHPVVPGKALGHYRRSLDVGIRNGPLMGHLVCRDREREIEARRIVPGIPERGSFREREHAGVGVHPRAVAGTLDDADVVVRVRDRIPWCSSRVRPRCFESSDRGSSCPSGHARSGWRPLALSWPKGSTALHARRSWRRKRPTRCRSGYPSSSESMRRPFSVHVPPSAPGATAT